MFKLKKAKVNRTFNSRIRLFLIFLIIFLIVFFSVDYQIRPIIKTAASNYAVAISTKEINNTVTDVLSRSDVEYDDLITIKYDNNMNVTSLTANIVKINKLKSKITSDIQNEIAHYDTQIIKIPIGNIMGSDYFMGFGPKIKFELSISGSIKSDLLSSFEQAGINQTKHQIILRVTSNVSALVPWINTHTSVTTDFILAESLIIGKIPETYSSLIATDTPLSDIIVNETE